MYQNPTLVKDEDAKTTSKFTIIFLELFFSSENFSIEKMYKLPI